jgi:hypothetical protein
MAPGVAWTKRPTGALGAPRLPQGLPTVIARTPARAMVQLLWISVRRFVRPSSKPLIQARASRLSFS